MKKYNITAVLPNGDEVRAKVVAASESAAIARIMESEPFKEFAGDVPHNEIKFYIDGAEEEALPIAIDACRLTTFEGVGCTVEHIASGVIIGFEEGRFNETAEVLNYPAMMTPERVAEIMREVSEWLYIFHRRKVFSLRDITRAYIAKKGLTIRALALEVGVGEREFGHYLRGCRPLPYEATENLLTILQQAGEL